MEIMRQIQSVQETRGRDVSAIFCCIGGGGLAAGVTAYVKSVYPGVRVYGVETVDSNAMVWEFERVRCLSCSRRIPRRIQSRALTSGHPVELDEVGLFADGAAVRVAGQHTLDVLAGHCGFPGIDGIVEVTNDELCAAIRDVFVETRTVLEPAGALGVAGLKKWVTEKGDRNGVYIAVCIMGASDNALYCHHVVVNHPDNIWREYEL